MHQSWRIAIYYNRPMILWTSPKSITGLQLRRFGQPKFSMGGLCPSPLRDGHVFGQSMDWVELGWIRSACSDCMLIILISRPMQSAEHKCALLLAYLDVAWSVCLSVCRCVTITIVSPVKTPEPIDMPSVCWLIWAHLLGGGIRVGATWRIRLNRPCSATMLAVAIRLL